MATEGFSLNGLLSIHAAMRRDTTRLARRAAQRPSAAEVASLARWFKRFRHQLDEHHHIEDDVFFPLLLARDPSLAGPFAALEGDHRAMVVLLERVSLGLAAGGGSALVVASAELAALIDGHLAAEEALVVPATARLLSVADQRAFERGLRQKSSLAEIGFALPWILSALSTKERAATLAELPLPLRLLYRFVWRRRYADLASALDAPVPPALPALTGATAR